MNRSVRPVANSDSTINSSMESFEVGDFISMFKFDAVDGISVEKDRRESIIHDADEGRLAAVGKTPSPVYTVTLRQPSGLGLWLSIIVANNKGDLFS